MPGARGSPGPQGIKVSVGVFVYWTPSSFDSLGTSLNHSKYIMKKFFCNRCKFLIVSHFQEACTLLKIFGAQKHAHHRCTLNINTHKLISQKNILLSQMPLFGNL